MGLGLGNAGKQDMLPKTITAHCAAPEFLLSHIEQTKGVNGPAADVWSSAVVLYLMLTGHLPFDCEQLAIPELPAGGSAAARFGMYAAIYDEHLQWVSTLLAFLPSPHSPFLAPTALLHCKASLAHHNM